MAAYCKSTFKTLRFMTREVLIGNVGVGGDNPIRIQSMTTSSTRDVSQTVDQIIKLFSFGCEIARVTVQGMKEAEACEDIKNILVKKGYNIPLVADIHFYPPAAMKVIDFVDKVRINPGNFADRRATFKILEYDDKTYALELEKIEEKFAPLVEKCKKLKRSMRIGTNHGSLSDRIMNRFGDTATGMVESAIEYTKIARKLDYHDIIFSMKASNTHVMIQAYRLLVKEMLDLGWDYPLHLGVTEAGQGEDGRIKSSIGIGSLLLDGLGDTIRVSLTEDPWFEIDPCKRLISFSDQYRHQKGLDEFKETYRDPFNYQKRDLDLKDSMIHPDGTVIVKVSEDDLEKKDLFNNLGCKVQLNRPYKEISTADGIVLESIPSTGLARKNLYLLKECGVEIFTPLPLEGCTYMTTLRELHSSEITYEKVAVTVEEYDQVLWKNLIGSKAKLIFLKPKEDRVHFSRCFFQWIHDNHVKIPIILAFDYFLDKQEFLIISATEAGSLLCDGIGEGVMMQANLPLSFLRKTCFNILQASRLRSSKTEFISCPSCGRTLFDLQTVTKRIEKRTGHLPGVKIAVMGCIVNGPGEMADADFGYVGSKPNKIDLYVGKECAERNIDYEDAVEKLVDLLKSHDRWIEPEKEESLEKSIKN